MSDFGTMVILRRRDGADLTPEDRARIEEGIAAVKAADSHRDALHEPFAFRQMRGGLGGGQKEVALLLSEYWLEGIDDAEDGGYGNRTPEDLLEHDRQGAEEVWKALELRLGDAFEVALICDTW